MSKNNDTSPMNTQSPSNRLFQSMFDQVDERLPDDVVILGDTKGNDFQVIYFMENKDEHFTGTYDELIVYLQNRTQKERPSPPQHVSCRHTLRLE